MTVITTMPPHGGPLVSLLAEPDRAAELDQAGRSLDELAADPPPAM